MVYKLVNSKKAVAKFLRDAESDEGDFSYHDIIEWIGEAIEKIGAPTQYTVKVAGSEGIPLLTVSNYQAKIPNDLHKLIGISYSSTATGSSFIPLRYGTGNYDHRPYNNASDTSTTSVSAETDIIALAMSLFDINYETALSVVNSDSILKSKLNTLLIEDRDSAVSTVTDTQDFTYVINSNYVKLNVKTGFLKMAYLAMPFDEDGFPLIPDTADYSEAIFWYVNMKTLYREWRGGDGRAKDLYYDSKNSWNFYRKQAYGNAMMPNADQLESMLNQWLTLYPEINQHASHFNLLGQQQLLYNH